MDTQEMTFTVAIAKAPDGNKPGSIKTDDGTWITAWPSEFEKFRTGGRYRATVYNKPYNNKDQWTVSKIDKGGKIEALDNAAPAPQNAGHAEPPPRTPYTNGNGDIPPILSNLLAHAIASGAIKEPAQLAEWAKGVKMAVQVYHNPTGTPY